MNDHIPAAGSPAPPPPPLGIPVTTTSNLPASPPRCQGCSSVLNAPGSPCALCGLMPGHLPPRVPFQAHQPQKSPIIAVLLTVLWLGAGQLYTGRLIVLGVLLMIWDSMLVLLGITGIGLILAIPLWAVTFIPAAVMAGVTANSANRPRQPQY